MDDLSGRHALVSGGGTGIGAAVALALADAGGRVAITGRRSEPLVAIAARHTRIRCVQGDVTDPASVAALVATATAIHGHPDIVVANAGAVIARPFMKMTAGDLQLMLAVNLVGVFNLWHAALAPMIEAGWGRLVAIASTAGLKGYAYVSAYCAAKHGAVGLTRALALETANTGVTVNAVCPGYTDTPMLADSIAKIKVRTGRSQTEAEAALRAANPQGRFIRPQEVAATVLWLCSAGAASITGQAISVSGGEV